MSTSNSVYALCYRLALVNSRAIYIHFSGFVQCLWNVLGLTPEAAENMQVEGVG